MDYNILNLIKPDINFTKSDTSGVDKLPNLSLSIKFNIPLNPHVLDNDSAFITDKHGDVIPSYVKYDKTHNAIKLLLKNEWSENNYYFLNIGGNIKSLSGTSLSGRVKFRFRIKDGKPVEFVLVSGKTSLGADRVNSNLKRADVRIIEKLPVKRKKDVSKVRNRLSYIFHYNIIVLFLVSVMFATLAVIFGGGSLLYLSVTTFLFFLLGLLVLIIGKKGRSQIQYNIGVFFFNTNKYEKSVFFFEKSLYYDKKNIKSQLALDLAFSQFISKI